jgi:hypothetical protein
MPSQAIILSIMFLRVLGWGYYQERTKPALAGLNCFLVFSNTSLSQLPSTSNLPV